MKYFMIVLLLLLLLLLQSTIKGGDAIPTDGIGVRRAKKLFKMGLLTQAKEELGLDGYLNQNREFLQRTEKECWWNC